jgi:cysteinyl-tRNA synthetase
MSDLDTSKAILRLRALEKDSTVGILDKRAIFLFADQVLGLDLAREAEPEIAAEIRFEALQLIEQRAAAREAKNWSESDRLRDLLASMDIAVVDGAEGQSWSIRI